MKFRRSLFGYEAASVQEKIRLMEQQFARVLEQLNNEIEQLNRETEILNERINRTELEISSNQSMNEEIINVLMTAHMEATEKVYQSMREAERMNRDLRDLLVKREMENNLLKDTLKKYTEDMQSIALDYNKALEAFSNE